MNTFVVDASIGIKWFIPELHSKKARQLKGTGYTLHVPDFFLMEIGNVLSKKHRRGELGIELTTDILLAIQDSPLHWHADKTVLPHAFELALETRQSLYDCLYLALARYQQAYFITADQKLLNGLIRTPYAQNLCWVEDLP